MVGSLGSIPKFLSLCGIAWVMVLGNSMLIPVLPQLGKAMTLTQVETGLIITSFSVGAGLTIPVFGLLSDHVGRKTIVVPSLVVFGVAGSAAGLAGLLLASPFTAILLARFLQGMGAGGTYQLAMTLTGDIFQGSERTRALGYLESSNGGGKVSAPLVGSALGAIAWYAPFLLYLVAALPVALAVWLAIKEPAEKLSRRPARVYLGQVRRAVRGQEWALMSCFSLGLMVLFLYFGVLSYLSDLLSSRHGITGITSGLVITIPVGTMAISALVSSRFLASLPRSLFRWGSAGGLILATVSLGAAAFLENLYLLVGSITLMSAGNGVALTSLNTLVTGAVDRDKRGLVVSLYGTVRHIGAASGPPVFGYLALGRDHSFLLWVALFGLGTAVISLVLLRGRLLKPRD